MNRRFDLILATGYGIIIGFMLCGLIATITPVVSKSIAECMIEGR